MFTATGAPRSAWEVAADLLAPVDDTWEPLPHQVPPAGRWFGWLLAGGRGAGKTATAARYVHDHVHGPPCLPGVPGGHWVGIIAPTLGDAATSCVYGPSGLRMHDPSVKIKQTAGGATVRWGNGAEAKLFGAHSPEDVERLRSGGNRCMIWCVKEGTPVLTETGWQPIEVIKPGDMVWTDSGWSSVTEAAMTNPAAQVIELTLSNGHVLACTPDHRLFQADGGQVYARDVTPGVQLAACQINSSLSRALHTSEPTVGSTTSTAAEGYTETSGHSTKVRYRLAMKFIILMKTMTTMTYPTSSASPSQNTPKSIKDAKVTRPGRLSSSLANIAMRLLSARLTNASTGHDSAQSCVETEPAPQQGSHGQNVRTLALSVARQLKTRIIAALSATTPQEQLTTESASGATNPFQDSVSVTVLQIAMPKESVPVYDLTVPGPAHFYASGIKVHNCEELAAWRYLDECWQHMRYGLRVGPWPHVIISTTPKPRKVYREIVAKAASGEGEFVMTKASTADNPHLDPTVKKMLFEDYAGTRLGRQELFAELLEEIEGALWLPETIEQGRIDFATMPTHMQRIVVGVDPGGVSTGETGIVVAGANGDWDIPKLRHIDLHDKSHGFVLGDYTTSGSPEKWSKAVVQAYRDWNANNIVAEINNGFEMVAHTLRTVDGTLPIREVHASRGKARRAQPVSALYEQGRVHHVGMFGHLEDQMCSFDPNELKPNPEDSPDRMDALVWAITDLMIDHRQIVQSQTRDDRLRGRR